jgi:subtilisin family serine protease
MGPLFRRGSLPAYHEGKLFVRMRAAPVGAPESIMAAGATFSGLPSVGLSALSFYERAGLLRRVIPVGRRKAQFAGHVMATPPSAAAAGFTALQPIAGEGLAAATLRSAAFSTDGQKASTTSLVELSRDEDVRQLQLALANDPAVESVSRVPLRYLAMPAGKGAGKIAKAAPDPATMWNLRTIRWAQARAMAGFSDAVTVKVAVLDTGIDITHPDLGPQVKSYVHEHPDLPGASSSQDIIGHGSHVSGTITALINNDLGINGICACELHMWKIFDDKPDLLQFDNGGAAFVYYVDPVMYLRALLDCADTGMDVVNLSIGGGGAPDPNEAEAFGDLIAGGATVVAAMGNEREQGSPTSYPAAIAGVVAVGATNRMDRVTPFSNRGNHISLCAPGDAIWSTLPTCPGQTDWEAVRGADGQWRQGKPNRRETDYDAWPGTSMATPHVTAAVALHLANGGARSPAAVRQALVDSADKVPSMGAANFSPDYGYGRLNLEKLVHTAKNPGP